FTAANAIPASTAVPANAHQVAASYDVTNCTITATSRPCPAPIAAAGAKARSARAAEGRRELSARCVYGRITMNDARAPNHSTAAASSGMAVGPKIVFIEEFVVTGSATTEASDVA